MINSKPKKDVTGAIVIGTSEKQPEKKIIKTTENNPEGAIKKELFNGETPEILENSEENRTIVKVMNPVEKKLKRKRVQLVYNQKPKSNNDSTA